MSTTEVVVDEIPVDPTRARVYCEGWQSWSPAAWWPAGRTGPTPAESWQHLMRFRPGTPVSPVGLQGEGLLVVDPGTGGPARCFGAVDLTSVPTLRADLRERTLVVTATAEVQDTTHAEGAEAALVAYADALAATHGAGGPRVPPRVWCSWYRYFEAVTADDVTEALRDLTDRGLPVDVVQVDDGWSAGLGEGLEPAPRFGDLARLVGAIRESGRRAGLWLAPFLVGADTALARDHPDWLVGPAGRNWDQGLRGLDLTHPGVRGLLESTLRALVELGIDYFKLDFLYGGAVPGRRYAGADGVEAYRDGLALVRRVVGPDVYVVACGAPLLPSVGLVDAMRVSPDTFHEGGEDGSTGLRGLMPLAARAWQQGRLWVNDPDCVVARPTYAHRRAWAAAARDLGGLRSFSDRVAELDAEGLDLVRDLLVRGGDARPFSSARLREASVTAAAEALARDRSEGTG